MDSPEPGSPISRSSSGSPMPDEPPYLLTSELASFMSSSRGESYLSGGKRRLPMGSVSSSGTKSRRREEAPGRRTGGGGVWQQTEIRDYTGGRAQREELVDQHIVDNIRTDWGDPFDESAIKTSS
ncbi:uncharacterized protein PHACADRAFT_261875 [Phanerochaete carnosa HHB-10118-sp]|uniref:Uncharacterized protein n=1 Tax=Phanerochaete carnosa (strain HHB-10118-sp) TaxID=650164 RepID=K5VXR7_PHACS|nr:uncharacterized protein PHACADRAFT_261875 [Phanerochaete carnosa HHB-10118-sp]EKM51625.1 hypothetical protein PHACADRAFT_261875 [Phanerochaete carnosa HHB-10118-sp]